MRYIQMVNEPTESVGIWAAKFDTLLQFGGPKRKNILVF